MGILPTRYSVSPTAHKMDTSTGGPSQQPGPTPAALVLARSGGMPRVGALRLAASSAPTRPVPQRAIAARQEEEQSRLAIGPGNRIRPVGVADSSNTRVEVAAPRGAVMQHHSLRGMEHRRQPESWLFRMQVRRHLRRWPCSCFSRGPFEGEIGFSLSLSYLKNSLSARIRAPIAV